MPEPATLEEALVLIADLRSEVTMWRAMSRKNERRAKELWSRLQAMGVTKQDADLRVHGE